jgi:hypothetical protein
MNQFMAKLKHTVPLTVAGFILAICVEESSADVYWNNNNGAVPGGDRSWGNANNWIGGSPSVAGAGNAIVKPWPNLQQMPIVNTLGNTANQVYLVEGSSMSVVEGGSLLVNAYVTGQWNNCGVTTVSGGLLQTGNLLVGSGSFDGDINISGGSVIANFLEIKTAGGAKLDISGGTVSTTTFSIYNPGGGVGMNIGANGSFVAGISELGNINYWIGNKSITANGGAAGWGINVDETSQEGKVVLTAVTGPTVGDTKWVGLVSDEWVEVNNWSNGLPSQARGDSSVLLDPVNRIFDPHVRTTGNTIPNDLYIGVGTGLIVGSGGELTVGRNFFTGIWGGSGVTAVSGGLLQASNLYVGFSEFEGDVNVSGGSVVVANLLEIKVPGGAKLDISGGTVEAGTLSIYTPGDVGVGMNIGANGSFIAAKSNLRNINYWIAANAITANNGAAGWIINVDTTSQPEKVILTARVSGYSSWADANAPSGTGADDEDADGVSNGVEYVLGGSENTSDSAKLPQLSISDGNVIFTFVRDQTSMSGATLRIQVGTDLVNWPITSTYTVGADTDGSASGVTILKNTPEIGKDTITLSRSQSGLPAKLFARLSVGIK